MTKFEFRLFKLLVRVFDRLKALNIEGFEDLVAEFEGLDSEK